MRPEGWPISAILPEISHLPMSDQSVGLALHAPRKMTISGIESRLGDPGKPETVLIEKISDAVAGVFKPFQIVRAAKAVEANRIRAEARIRVTD